MKVLIAGASGFVGHALVPYLKSQGHEVYTLTRKKSQDPHAISWDPEKGEIDRQKLQGFDAFINLSGENIMGLWTESKRRKILESRVKATTLLAKTATELPSPPQVFINASAIGYYGSRGDEPVSEQSSKGQGFLPDVVQAWENAAEPVMQAGIRTVFIRTGLVLSKDGGALQKMLTPFRLGLGGRIGSGHQYWSWISLEDLVGIFNFALTHPISGPVNAVAPQSVTNAEFTETLGKVLNRPTFLPIPETPLKLLLGQFAEELFLSSANVKADKIQTAGYSFKYPNLESCLKKEAL